ncbi:GroES-like protein [Rhizopus microsporus var. microsporus]|uniref:NAD and Zn-dependent alcohol dehydrogenase n=2 Tax=Rhizopus microsporus TaxID=58291 RepID=A0A2G4SKK5_RHIZD|nr:NAD and Zn-dependent alcohol dehydrogenase [Rhizopus microsporus ATCC 52813]ORE06313.1 GroES-like protein [Rhizopus microsporus var. microsporus]PHZ09301.1 NAD and Zn-dependent alcohol dehydrogenase [Rhizopus microsporus ATCC 52813]
MSKNDTFTGWASVGKDKPLEQMQLPLKAWNDNSVEMDITHCGICGSDVHTIDSGWGPTDYPCVVGHEITGVVTRVGKNVTRVKVGDRAGLGPACGSCNQCHTCSNGEENVCMNGITLTYNSHWSTGEKTYGGYADKWRGDETFICKIPDNVSNENASTFMCGGVTTYAPLRRWKVGPGSTLGVLGIGGLGHFAVMFGKALGATVIAFSSSNRKRDAALELGCDDYIVTSDTEAMTKYTSKLTHIICTGVGEDFKWEPYFNLLVPNGIFINVNAPEFSYPPIPLFNQIFKQIVIVASAGGSVKDTEDMLQLISEKNLKAWYKKYPMSEVNKAIKDFRAGLPRFRFVLEN